MPAGGAHSLPLVGTGTQKSKQERRPWRRVASLPPPGSSFNEKMLYGASVFLYFKAEAATNALASVVGGKALLQEGRINNGLRLESG